MKEFTYFEFDIKYIYIEVFITICRKYTVSNYLLSLYLESLLFINLKRNIIIG